MDDMPATIGRMVPCQHSFCFVCIRKWTAEESNDCPLCKNPATEIEKVTRIALSERMRSVDGLTPLDIVQMEGADNCKVCGSGAHAESLLLCDSCGGGTHTFCLECPRTTIPPGQWFCADCRVHDDICQTCGAQACGALRVDAGKCLECKGETVASSAVPEEEEYIHSEQEENFDETSSGEEGSEESEEEDDDSDDPIIYSTDEEEEDDEEEEEEEVRPRSRFVHSDCEEEEEDVRPPKRKRVIMDDSSDSD